jgi:ABC-type nitrate/sulfonate/bicarbonate transport system substrate-binding protein
MLLKLIISGILLFTVAAGGISAEDQPEIRLGITGTYDEIPLLIALEKGYFREEKLNVTAVKINHGELYNKIRRGTVDIVLVNYNAIPVIAGNELPVKIISSLFYSTKPESYCFFVLQDSAGDNLKNRLRSFFAAVQKGIDWSTYNPDTAAGLLVREKYLQGKPDDISSQITAHSWNISATDARENVADYLKAHGINSPVLYRSAKSLDLYDNKSCCLVDLN